MIWCREQLLVNPCNPNSGELYHSNHPTVFNMLTSAGQLVGAQLLCYSTSDNVPLSTDYVTGSVILAGNTVALLSNYSVDLASGLSPTPVFEGGVPL